MYNESFQQIINAVVFSAQAENSLPDWAKKLTQMSLPGMKEIVQMGFIAGLPVIKVG